MFPRPAAATAAALFAWADRIVGQLNRRTPPGVLWIDVARDGVQRRIRLCTSASTDRVRLQLQSTAAGKGGGAYSPTDYVARGEFPGGVVVDVPAFALNGVDRHTLFCIPIGQPAGSSAQVVYDGQGGAADLVRWADLGV